MQYKSKLRSHKSVIRDYELRHDKSSKMAVRPAKTQISLGIRSVWSESLLSAWRKVRYLATHWAYSEDSDQTKRMPRLIWVFAGRTLILLVLSWLGSYGLLCGSQSPAKGTKYQNLLWKQMQMWGGRLGILGKCWKNGQFATPPPLPHPHPYPPNLAKWTPQIISWTGSFYVPAF